MFIIYQINITEKEKQRAKDINKKLMDNISMNSEINQVLGSQIKKNQQQTLEMFDKLNDNIIKTSNCLKDIKSLQKQFESRITKSEDQTNKKFHKMNNNILAMNEKLTKYQESNLVQNGSIISNTNKINEIESNINLIKKTIASSAAKVDQFLKQQV